MIGKYEVEDLKQLLGVLQKQRSCCKKVGVLGVGYGATLAMHWAAHDPRVGPVVAIAPYDQPEQAFARMAKAGGIHIEPGVLHAALRLAETKLGIGWTDWSGTAAVRQLKQPVFLIGGGKKK